MSERNPDRRRRMMMLTLVYAGVLPRIAHFTCHDHRFWTWNPTNSDLEQYVSRARG